MKYLYLFAVILFWLSEIADWYFNDVYPNPAHIALLFWISWNAMLFMGEISAKEIRARFSRTWLWVEKLLFILFLLLVARRLFFMHAKLTFHAWDGQAFILIVLSMVVAQWIVMRQLEVEKRNTQLSAI